MAAAGGVLDWPGAGDLTGPLLAKAAEVAQSAVGARPDPGVAPACRVLGQVPPDRRPWAAGVLAGVARGGGTAARAAAAAALASVCEGCATPQVLSAAWPAARALSTDPSDKVQPHGLRSVALLLHAAGPSGPPGGDEERAAVAGTMAEAVRRGSPKTALNACNAALRLVEAGGLSEEAWAEGLARALVGALERGSTLKLRVRAVAALRAMLAGWQGGDAPWARDAWAACCAVAKEEIAGRADGELAPLAEELRGLLRLGTAPEDMGGEVRAAMDALAEGL